MRAVEWKLATVLLVALTTASCGGSGGGGGGAPAFGNLALEGTVLYANGDPAPNIAVRIAGRGPFVTGAGGTFVVNDAPVPYDAIVFDGASGSATVWRGLTRPDPVFTIGVGVSDLPFDADVDGTVTGGVGLPVPSTHETRVLFGVEDALGGGTAVPDGTTGDYVDTDMSWWGPAATDLHITAIQYAADADGNPVTFSGYGTLTVPLTTGDVLVNQDIVMGPIATGTISGTVTSAEPLAVTGRSLLVGVPGGGLLFLPVQTGGGPNFALQSPDAPGISRTLFAIGADLASNQVIRVLSDLPASATGVNLELPSVTALVLPVDGATGIDYGTEFRVTPSPGDRVFRAEFRPTSGSGPTIHLVTADSTFRIPDLTAYGMGLPAGEEYTWSARGQGPATSVDDAAVESNLEGLLLLLGAADGFTASGGTRSIFLAP